MKIIIIFKILFQFDWHLNSFLLTYVNILSYINKFLIDSKH